MAKYLIIPILITALSLLSCDPITTEPPDFGTAYAGWITTIITNMSGQDIDARYDIIVLDKDRSNIYPVWNISKTTKPNELFMGYEALGLDGAHYGLYPGIILRDEKTVDEPRVIPTIRKTLISNNVTNAEISFFLEVVKGTKRIILTGFDEGITNITNICANMYGLGYYDAVFDGQQFLTNVVIIVPMNSSTNDYNGWIIYEIEATTTELRIGKGTTFLTNIPF